MRKRECERGMERSEEGGVRGDGGVKSEKEECEGKKKEERRKKKEERRRKRRRWQSKREGGMKHKGKE